MRRRLVGGGRPGARRATASARQTPRPPVPTCCGPQILRRMGPRCRCRRSAARGRSVGACWRAGEGRRSARRPGGTRGRRSACGLALRAPGRARWPAVEAQPAVRDGRRSEVRRAMPAGVLHPLRGSRRLPLGPVGPRRGAPARQHCIHGHPGQPLGAHPCPRPWPGRPPHVRSTSSALRREPARSRGQSSRPASAGSDARSCRRPALTATSGEHLGGPGASPMRSRGAGHAQRQSAAAPAGRVQRGPLQGGEDCDQGGAAMVSGPLRRLAHGPRFAPARRGMP